MHKQINDVRLDGFAVSSAAAGETVKVQVKGSATSESPFFLMYAEQIANLIFPKLGSIKLKDEVNNYLAVIHIDNTADVYIQEFATAVKVKLNRSIKVGEPIYPKDIDDMVEVSFPGISIKSDDKVVFLKRSGWRFGIYFDFTKQINIETLGVDLANIHKTLILEDNLKNVLAEIQTKMAEDEAFIITEGKTDWKHLEIAFRKINYLRRLGYSKQEKALGDAGLLEICKRAIHLPSNKLPIICVFDRDNPTIIKELNSHSGNDEVDYQSWGNNVFSMMIPQPPERVDYSNISIEMYYSDETIKRKTKEGKRLFFDNELKAELIRGKPKKMISISPVIDTELDKKVYSTDVENIEDSSGKKVGISKTVFAEVIYSENEPFKEVDFENFRHIARIIEKILTNQE